ncbi:hypothetical protein ACLOJK_032960 [Asimina triloba]
MSSYKGSARKRSREDDGVSNVSERPRNLRLPAETIPTFHIPEMVPPPRATAKKLVDSNVNAEKGSQAGKGDESEKRVCLDSPAPLENPTDLQTGWWEWDFPRDVPWYDEQLCLGWFSMLPEDDFMGLCTQNEEIWEDDLWQIKHIHQIPNQ